MKLKWKILNLGSIALIGSGLIVGNVIAARYAPIITTALSGTGVSFDTNEFKQAAAQSNELCQDIEGEGIVMLKNVDNALPLSTKKVNVFGWGATNQGFLLSGIGSGSSTISDDKKVTFLEGLKDDGFEYNQDLIDMYNNYDSTDYGYTSSRMKLIEPDSSYYTNDLIDNAKSFSDVALVVISRVSGENVGEVPTTQPKSHGQATDTTRNYLQISAEEEDLLNLVESNFSKVVVIINSTNTMELGFLNNSKISAALNVGIPGQSGAVSIAKVLSGEINPSGHLTDTVPYDISSSPSYSNYRVIDSNIGYLEDIYVGYKWYETANEEGYFDDVTNDYGTGYDGVVQYPFGYGLSYTNFEWGLTNVSIPSGSDLHKDSDIELTFSCTNTGTKAGKDVMGIYYTAPYIDGEIEKSSINLVQYAKTAEIDPGQTQTDIVVDVSAYDMASFDSYDDNDNGYTTWELDPGTYTIKFMSDSHTAKTMAQGNVNSVSYNLPETVVYDKDPITGQEVTDRFTGEEAYSGVPLDGSTLYKDSSDAPVYLSRSDFKKTYPKTLVTPTDTVEVKKANNYVNDSFNQTEMPDFNVKNGLYLATKSDGKKASLKDLNGSSGTTLTYNDDLISSIAQDYDSQDLANLVDEMSKDDLENLVENAGFKTQAIESIGLPQQYCFDGPAGFNENTQTGVSSGEWTAFPDETVIGQTWSKYIAKQMGLSMGAEGQATGISGWYAPGVNIHRSPFNGRNYEYYSEDSVLNGYMAANVIEGAKANGVHCYLKHLALSEEGDNPRNVNTWTTEQALREIYLKPFEIAVKDGGANGLMTAFNSVGGVWSGANYAMNDEIVRDEWGFRGSIITDWSDGSGNMTIHSGIRGGNDIWLNPNIGNISSKLDTTDPTDIYCAKIAAKNVIYTFANTYWYAKNYDHSNDEVVAQIGTEVVATPFAWWIPVLVVVDGLVVGGLATWTYFVLRKKKDKKDKPKIEAK